MIAPEPLLYAPEDWDAVRGSDVLVSALIKADGLTPLFEKPQGGFRAKRYTPEQVVQRFIENSEPERHRALSPVQQVHHAMDAQEVEKALLATDKAKSLPDEGEERAARMREILLLLDVAAKVDQDALDKLLSGAGATHAASLDPYKEILMPTTFKPEHPDKGSW